jgi:hypothetical protein
MTNGSCPSCVLHTHYDKDGSFAAFVDYMDHPNTFYNRVKKFIDGLMAENFEDGVGVKLKAKKQRQYFKTGLGLIGCPDVAEILEKDVNQAKRILAQRFRDLKTWDESELHGDEVSNRRIIETLRRWQDEVKEFDKHPARKTVSLQLIK